MKKWKFAVSVGVLIVILCAPLLLQAEDEHDAAAERLQEVYHYISKYHVSGMSGDELTEAAIEGMIQALDDPFTSYLTPDEYSSFTDSINQNYVGIGVRIAQEEDGFYAVEVFANSPAEQSGILPGDRFVEVEGEPVTHLTIDDLVSKIKGPEGSTVEVSIDRQGERIPLTLERRAVQIPSVEAKWFDDGLGYIRFGTFSEEAEKSFAKELNHMKEQGLNRLIVDLRGNTGGYLNVAEAMVAHFLEEGTLLYMQNRGGSITPHRFSNGENLEIPIVLLVDGLSASASELFSGALQDYGKAVIIGNKTYGKGSVQQLVPLTDGAYLRLTVQQYLTPKKRQVDQIGITPDLEVFGQTAQLLTALRHLDADSLNVKAGTHEWSVNGNTFQSSFPYIEEDHDVYIPSRILAALTGAAIEWNGKMKQVEFHFQSGERVSFSVTEEQDVIMEHGVSFINAKRFQQVFSKFDFTFDGNELELSVS